MGYLTDGIHLYEITRVVENYGLLRGQYTTVRDCRTGVVRSLCPLESLLCEPVNPRGC